ncbi:RNA helicase [Pseudomonas syringae pv. spinaceae]|uniref:RNA helicase n=1 Tax=Pseudomonas syringae pv. spinaceae TaxID=264459 RepID=A0A0Q0A7X9_PSESX|nr:RNA helicase [Pseudomonas syringae pv. spinaceae]
MPIALRQIVIDLRRCGLHGHFAQRGEVGLGEEGVDGSARLLRYVDLAVAQALEQLAWRQVDQHQVEGFLQHPIGQCFTHLHAGDAAHLIIEAFQVLDVDGGIDVDAGREQFLNVLPAFGVPAAGRIGVRQFVDQHQARRRLEQRVEVHFFEGHAAVFGAQQGLLRQAVEQRLGFRAAVGFHHARHHPDALA